jgi:hypothetical protein
MNSRPLLTVPTEPQSHASHAPRCGVASGQLAQEAER